MLIDKIRMLDKEWQRIDIPNADFECWLAAKDNLEDEALKMAQALIAVDDVLKKAEHLDGLIENEGDTPYHMVIVKHIRKAIEPTEDTK